MFRGRPSIQLGAEGVDTIIEIEVGNKTNLNPTTLIGSISGQADIVSTAPQPSDFSVPATFEAHILLNLSKDSFLAWGEISSGNADALYGQVALLVQKRPATAGDPNSAATWGFVLSATLKNWTFATISATLRPVDAVLSIDTVSVALANFEADTQTAPFDKLQLSTVSSSRPVKPGLNLYGHLTFHTNLLQNVASFLINIDQAFIEVYAYIGQNAADTLFTAELGNFTVLQVIHFSSLRLEYQPSLDTKTLQPQTAGSQPTTTSVLRIIGKAMLSVPLEFDQLQSCQFDGTLTIDDKKAIFVVSTPSDQQLIAPLGMFGITFKNLALSIDYSFGDFAAPTVIQLGGQIGFGRQADGAPQFVLNGNIVWVGGSAVLVDISLAQPLGIIVFFTSIFTDSIYPADYVDLVLKRGTHLLLQKPGRYFSNVCWLHVQSSF